MSNISNAKEFWDVESFDADSFRDWADDEIREHGEVSFDDWADEEYNEVMHNGANPLTFVEWVNQEKREVSHNSESFAATSICFCGNSCNCDCGCSEFGVCLCDSSCPCDCGCGVSVERPTEEETKWEREMMKAKRMHSKSREGSSMRKLLRQYRQRKSAESFDADGCNHRWEVHDANMETFFKKVDGNLWVQASCRVVCANCDRIWHTSEEWSVIDKRFMAESFEAEVCPCGCAIVGCVCSPSCKGECLGAESFEADVDWEGKPYTGQINPDDPDLDPVKADRNKDGRLSSWERALGNQVARGIREGGYGSEEFELHDWYDPESDYGDSFNHPAIVEQRKEYDEWLGKEKIRLDKLDEDKLKKADIGRRIEIIDAAVDKQKRITNIPYRPPPSLIPLKAKPIFGDFHISKVVKWGVVGLVAVGIGYKVASN